MQIPYLGLSQQLLWACPNTPMILLEVPHVSLRLQLRAMSVDDVAHAAAQILWRHSYQEACFMAHSYGTFCASRICQLHRSMVHSMVSSPSKPEDSTVSILIELWHTTAVPFVPYASLVCQPMVHIPARRPNKPTVCVVSP